MSLEFCFCFSSNSTYATFTDISFLLFVFFLSPVWPHLCFPKTNSLMNACRMFICLVKTFSHWGSDSLPLSDGDAAAVFSGTLYCCGGATLSDLDDSPEMRGTKRRGQPHHQSHHKYVSGAQGRVINMRFVGY